jgi:hypothetical protein
MRPEASSFQVFSIELAHLLFAAASEVDTVAKCVCQILDPKAKCENIDHYRKIITQAEEEQTYPFVMEERKLKVKPEHRHSISELSVFIPHCNVQLVPWQTWATDTNPDWWHSYNKVKHQRNDYFNQATLYKRVLRKPKCETLISLGVL